MAQISLHPEEARAILSGYLIDSSPSFGVRLTGNPYRGLEVESKMYRSNQKVLNGKKIRNTDLIKVDNLEEDYSELIEFMSSPLSSELETEEARVKVETLLDNCEEYLEAFVDEKVEKSLRFTQKDENQMEGDF